VDEDGPLVDLFYGTLIVQSIPAQSPNGTEARKETPRLRWSLRGGVRDEEHQRKSRCAHLPVAAPASSLPLDTAGALLLRFPSHFEDSALLLRSPVPLH